MILSEELKNSYIKFLDNYDPYWEIYEGREEIENEPLESMLYNMEEIKKDIDTPENMEDPEMMNLLIFLNDALLKFRDAGIKASI